MKNILYGDDVEACVEFVCCNGTVWPAGKNLSDRKIEATKTGYEDRTKWVKQSPYDSSCHDVTIYSVAEVSTS